MPNYFFLILLYFCTNSLYAQNFRDFIKKIDVDSISVKLSKKLVPRDELKTLITIIKSSNYNNDFNYILPKVKNLSDSLNVNWGKNMYHYLQGLTYDIKQKDSAATYFIKALAGFKATKDTSGIIMCNLKLYNLHFDILLQENEVKVLTTKYRNEFEHWVSLSKHPHDIIMKNWFSIHFNNGVQKIKLKQIEKLYSETIDLIDNNKNLESYRLFLSNAMQMEYSRLGLGKEYLKFAEESYVENKEKNTRTLDIVTLNYAYA